MSFLAAALALALAAPEPSAAPPASPAPAADLVLARAKAAQGGAAWDGVRSLRVEGRLSLGGLEGPAESVTDVRGGRFVDRYALGPAKGANGYDGKAPWSQDASGQSRVDGGETPVRSARTEAFRRAQAWWYPERARGAIRALAARDDGARRLDVLEVVPEGGRAFELWVDRESGLFDRFVETIGGQTFVTHLEDWREVDGVKVPFRVRTTRVGGEAKHDQVLTVSRVARDVEVPDALFAMPPPPPRDFGFAGGKRSTTVPFEIANGHIYADVRLDGKGPFRLLVDTGGVNLVTPALAKELGVEAVGTLPGGGVGQKTVDVGLATIGRVELGDAFVERQVFYVFALDALASVEGRPVLGLVGYEIFRRFTAEIDYAKNRLTLFDPEGFVYRGKGATLPFVFEEHTPQVEGALDGLPGRFDLDTGSRASLDVLSPFAKEHGLAGRYRTTPERICGFGVGGPSRGVVTRARSLRLGAVEVPGVVTALSTATKGAFARAGVAGNVGYGVLSRFTVTFDYGRRQVHLEKNARFAAPDPYDRSGLWLNLGDGAWEVAEAVPGTPAADVGLAAGDRILSAEGKGPAALTLHALRARLREAPAGTAIPLRVRPAAGGAERTVRLVLRDLVP